jgi:FkbM family methyltransferase
MATFNLWLLRCRKLLWVLRHRKRLQLLRNRAAPSLEHEDLLVGKRYATVVDVGANVGQFALFALDKLGPTNLVCVEPQPGSLDYLMQLSRRSRCRLTVETKAFGDCRRKQRLHITRGADNSSLLLPTARPSDAHRAMAVRCSIEVDVVLGDDVLLPLNLPGPTLLKVDVQGSELQVLRGLERSLSRIDSVLVEVSFGELYEQQSSAQEVLDLLGAHGFALSAIARVPSRATGWTLAQADLLFERASEVTDVAQVRATPSASPAEESAVFRHGGNSVADPEKSARSAQHEVTEEQ